MANAIIYVFSGTGNTKKVCKCYQQEFEKQNIPTTLFDITNDFSNVPNPADFTYVGFAYPVHGFNAPYIVLDFVKQLETLAEKKQYFIVKTSGEPLKLNNISSIKMNSILKKKGYELTNEYHYVMPYNMIFRHTDTMSVKMWQTAKALACVEANEILREKRHYLSKVPFGRAVSFIFRIEHPAMKLNGRLFKIDEDKCIHCNKCVRACPVGNISVDENGKFKFGGDCIMCTRCSFSCPTDAFNIALLNGWRINGEYEMEKAPEVEQKSKHDWYCKKAYIKYFDKAQQKIDGIIDADDVQ